MPLISNLVVYCKIDPGSRYSAIALKMIEMVEDGLCVFQTSKVSAIKIVI